MYICTHLRIFLCSWISLSGLFAIHCWAYKQEITVDYNKCQHKLTILYKLSTTPRQHHSLYINITTKMTMMTATVKMAVKEITRTGMDTGAALEVSVGVLATSASKQNTQ